MKLTDSRDIAAPPDLVWTAILDPEVLRECIPGCQSLTGSVDDGYEAVVKQKIGPVSATFTGIVTLSDIIPGQSVRISGEGKGGPAGFAKGGALVTLEPGGAGTILAYDVEAAIGGKLAQLGSRLIDGFAKKLAEEFFTRFQAAVEGPDDGTEEDIADSGEVKKGWFKRLIGG
ncbi:MAG: carbon monoxide dehydrogenase subunit G [Rhodobacter sp.]|jgi:carbon monoxide dehydrogenase subunit G|nr:carbon monoxide dehydrogenase subunit G [Rhodobacter sp.]